MAATSHALADDPIRQPLRKRLARSSAIRTRAAGSEKTNTKPIRRIALVGSGVISASRKSCF